MITRRVSRSHGLQAATGGKEASQAVNPRASTSTGIAESCPAIARAGAVVLEFTKPRPQHPVDKPRDPVGGR